MWIVRVGLPSGSTELAIAYGLEDFLRWGLPWSLSEGGVEDLRRGNNAVLDESAQTRFGAFNVGDHREFQGRRLKIVGKARGRFPSPPPRWHSSTITCSSRLTQ